MLGLDGGGHVLGRHVVVVACVEAGDDGPPGGGDAPALAPEQLEGRGDPGVDLLVAVDVVVRRGGAGRHGRPMVPDDVAVRARRRP